MLEMNYLQIILLLGHLIHHFERITFVIRYSVKI